MDLSTSAQPSGCICPPAREPHDPVDAFIHPQPSAPTWLRPRGSSWARKGRGLTRRPLATTRRNVGAGLFGRYPRSLLRRSLPSRRIATGETRHWHTHAECTKRPNASQPRRHSRTHFTALRGHGFAAESRPHACRIPAAVRWQHEASRIVNPMIPDLAVAARRLSAARWTHPYITRSDRTLSPGHACAARRKQPSHADTDMALRCRPRTPPSPQLGAEAAPIQIIV
jgi:hypothetical protein